MSNKFADMAARVAHEHAEHVADEQRKRDDAHAKAEARIDREIADLQQYVRPVLQEAITAFAGTGMSFYIKEHFDVRNRGGHVAPALSFYAVLSSDDDRGSRNVSRPVFFLSDSGRLTVRDRQGGGGLDIGSSPFVAAQPIIDKGIEWALKAYHEDIAEGEWRRGR